MATVPSKMTNQIAAIDAEVERLLAKKAKIEAMPQDDYANGAVVVFEKKFAPGGIVYTYAAVKGGGFWYLSGNHTRFSWESLLDELYGRIQEGGFVTPYWVTEITAIP